MFGKPLAATLAAIALTFGGATAVSVSTAPEAQAAYGTYTVGIEGGWQTRCGATGLKRFSGSETYVSSASGERTATQGSFSAIKEARVTDSWSVRETLYGPGGRVIGVYYHQKQWTVGADEWPNLIGGKYRGSENRWSAVCPYPRSR